MIEDNEVERMADEIDRAEKASSDALQSQIEAARAVETAPSDWDKETCYVCGNDLPEFRVKTNRFRCVGCQTVFETKKKGY